MYQLAWTPTPFAVQAAALKKPPVPPIVPAPEPSDCLLLGLGLIIFALACRKRGKR